VHVTSGVGCICINGSPVSAVFLSSRRLAGKTLYCTDCCILQTFFEAKVSIIVENNFYEMQQKRFSWFLLIPSALEIKFAPCSLRLIILFLRKFACTE
jgi:hypothetical protein